MKDVTVLPNVTIRQAMKKLSRSGEKCLVIVDENDGLLGTLSDGDLRKAVLKGADVGDFINDIYQRKPTVLVEGRYGLDDARELFTKNKFDLIPVVDNEGRVADILLWETVLQSEKSEKTETLNVPVVIMAGGEGARLEPFTKVLPKPLVPIRGKPVIEHIIERFTDVGVKEFVLTINYKARIMKAFFEELQPDFSIQFVEEREPLGTAGSLKNVEDRFCGPIFVTNCDIIVRADYRDLLSFHENNGSDITLVASMKNYVIPYGTCELDGDGYLKQITEKPEYDFLVNTGLYVLNPDVLHLIPSDKRYHVTHLIKDAQRDGKKIGVYPIDDDDWIDVGQWAEYQKAVSQL